MTASSANLDVVTASSANLAVVTDPSAGVTTDESILCPRTTAKKLNPLAGAVVNVIVLPAIVKSLIWILYHTSETDILYH